MNRAISILCLATLSLPLLYCPIIPISGVTYIKNLRIYDHVFFLILLKIDDNSVHFNLIRR